MADYITKIRTADGDKQIDYNALANLPDLTSDWKILNSVTTTEAVNSIEITTDSEGNTFSLDDVRVLVYCPFDQTNGVAKGTIRLGGQWSSFTSSSVNLVNGTYNNYARNIWQKEVLRSELIPYSIITSNCVGSTQFNGYSKESNYPTINVKVALDDTTRTFPVGTIVEVYTK